MIQAWDFVNDRILWQDPKTALIDLPWDDERIDFWQLSVRASNVLRNMNIRTIREITEATEHDLLRQPNCGRKSTKEIKEMLATYGFSLATGNGNPSRYPLGG